MHVLPAGMTFVLMLLVLTGCGDNSRDAPVTTSSPAGQSTAPSAATAEQRNNALVRVVHAVPAGATLDVYADTNRVFEGLAFKTVTPYQEIDGQRYTFRLRPAGMSQADPLASNREGLEDGEHYTIFVVPGDDTAAALRVVADEHTPPSSAQARVRVVQASRDAGEIDIYAVGRNEPLFDGVDFQAVTGYDEVTPMTGALELRPAGQPQAMLTVPNVALEAGKSFTIVVVGRVRTAPPLEVFVIEDRIDAAPTRR